QKAFSSSPSAVSVPIPGCGLCSALLPGHRQALPVHPTCKAGCQPRAGWQLWAARWHAAAGRDVALGVSPSEILAPALYHGYYIRPRINKQLERGTSEICLNQHKFQVFLDVCQFLPDELSVRTVDNLLEVAGQHPQKADRHGFVSREFTRTYILPLDVDPLLVRATLSHDGILSIVAPRTGKEVKARVNEVEITQQEQPVGKEEWAEEGKEKEKS
uniref:Heat shock protein family B (small) member 2 n=1 Tax=Serinus canaria TaxID=9135 RepID=A0A8C9MZ32_SERCA